MLLPASPPSPPPPSSLNPVPSLSALASATTLGPAAAFSGGVAALRRQRHGRGAHHRGGGHKHEQGRLGQGQQQSEHPKRVCWREDWLVVPFVGTHTHAGT